MDRVLRPLVIRHHELKTLHYGAILIFSEENYFKLNLHTTSFPEPRY